MESINVMVDRHSAVGKATRYGLDAPRINSRWRQDFRNRPDRPWSSNSLLHKDNGGIPEAKRPGVALNVPPT